MCRRPILADASWNPLSAEPRRTAIFAQTGKRPQSLNDCISPTKLFTGEVPTGIIALHARWRMGKKTGKIRISEVHESSKFISSVVFGARQEVPELVRDASKFLRNVL